MLRSSFLCIVFLGCSFLSAIGQESTFLPPPEPIDSLGDSVTVFSAPVKSLLIVPFRPDLYMSHMDRQIHETNQLDQQQIKTYMRLGLDNALMIAAKPRFQPQTLHKEASPYMQDLRYVYQSTSYDHLPVPKQKTEDKEEDKKIAKPEIPVKEKPRSTRVEEGQLVSSGDYLSQYLSTKINDTALIPSLVSSYNPELILFINQLDVLNAGTDYRDYESDNFQRIIRVHYSVFDQSGNHVIGGVAIEVMSSRTTDLREILNNHMTSVADKIITQLFLELFPPEEETSSNKR